MAGWLAGWRAGWLAGWLVARSPDRKVAVACSCGSVYPLPPIPSFPPNLSRDGILRRERSDKSIPVQEFGDAESNDPTGCVFSTDGVREGVRGRIGNFLEN